MRARFLEAVTSSHTEARVGSVKVSIGIKAYTRRRLFASLKLGLATVPFFVLLALLQDWPLVPGIFLFSFAAGFAVGVAELFLLKRWLNGLPFLPHLVTKSFVLVTVMYISFALLNLLDVAIDGISWREYVDVILSPTILLVIIEGFGVVVILLFFVQLDRLLGPGVLLGYVFGRYHRPKHEERVFMFLDLKGSTSLAEQLDADRYYSFLHSYFAAMSEPILAAEAKIYQYVGDEVVLTWKLKQGLEEANCIRVFFWIKDQMESQRQRFEQEYGTVPEFKAGVHFGEVITAQIGELKSEIVYNGDVLNTAARIQAKCNEMGHDLLVSADLAKRLDVAPEYRFLSLGDVSLTGKQDTVGLCAVDRVLQE